MSSSYIVTTLTQTTGQNDSAWSLTGQGDTLFVTNTGSLVALSGGSYGLQSTGDNEAITVDGEVYSAFDAGIYVGGSSTSVVVNGTAQSGQASGILVDSDASGDSITVDGTANSGGAEGVHMLASSSVLRVDGLVQGLAGILITGDDDTVTVGAQGVISGTGQGTSGVGLEASGVPDSVSVTNDGHISGTNYGVFSQNDGGIVLTNDGTISAAGVGIVFSDNNISQFSYDTLTNTGTIAGDNGIVVENGTAANVFNSGTIDGNSFYAFNVTDTSSLYLDNTGTVQGYINLDSTGANSVTNSGKLDGGISFGSGTSVLTNSHSLTGFVEFGDLAGGMANITNSGTMSGGIFFGAGNDGLTNTGSISGNISFGTGNDALTNSGAITGSITFAGSDDAFTNSGTISGGISFSGKTDTFTNNGSIHGSVTFGTSDTIANDGTVYGTLALGDNDKFVNTGTIHGNIDANTFDQITISPGKLLGDVVAEAHDSFHFAGAYGAQDISGFVATGTGHDTLYFSTSDFANYAAVEAHMTQASGDVLITLDAGDVVTLVGTTLSSLSATDFAFS